MAGTYEPAGIDRKVCYSDSSWGAFSGDWRVLTYGVLSAPLNGWRRLPGRPRRGELMLWACVLVLACVTLGCGVADGQKLEHGISGVRTSPTS